MQTLVDNQTSQNSSRVYRPVRLFWFAYFIVTIGAIGAVFAYGLVLPMNLLARRIPELRKVSAKTLQVAVKMLMNAQPWYSTQMRVDGLTAILRQKRPVLFVSNHRSHLDVFVLLTLIPGLRVLAKQSLFSVPGLAAIMRSSRQIPVEPGRLDRFMEAMDSVRHEIAAGEKIHVFPELTRCEAGARALKNFSTAPFKAAREAEALIVPLVFLGTDRAWPKGEVGISPATIRVEMLEAVDSTKFQSASELTSEIKRLIESHMV